MSNNWLPDGVLLAFVMHFNLKVSGPKARCVGYV